MGGVGLIFFVVFAFWRNRPLEGHCCCFLSFCFFVFVFLGVVGGGGGGVWWSFVFFGAPAPGFSGRVWLGLVKSGGVLWGLEGSGRL